MKIGCIFIFMFHFNFLYGQAELENLEKSYDSILKVYNHFLNEYQPKIDTFKYKMNQLVQADEIIDTALIIKLKDQYLDLLNRENEILTEVKEIYIHLVETKKLEGENENDY